MCLGFYKESIQIGGKSYEISSLKKSYNKGSQSGKVTWYSVPRFKGKFNGDTINGTIRSAECDLRLKGPGHHFQSVCNHCEMLIKNQGFLKRVQRANESTLAKKNDGNLSGKNN